MRSTPVIALIVCLAPAVSSQPPPKTEQWEAVITMSSDFVSDSTVDDTHTHNELHSEAHITAVLDAYPSAGSYESLRLVRMTGSGTAHGTDDSTAPTRKGHSETSANFDPTAANELTFVAGEGGIVVSGTLHFKMTSSGKEQVLVHKQWQTVPSNSSGDAPNMIAFDGPGTKAMVQSRHFTGTKTEKADPRTGQTGSSTITIDIHPLGPKAEVEVVIDAPDYEKWLPQQGNNLLLTATLRAKTGTVPADLKLSKLTWKLAGTSQEPGTSLNWPADPKNTETDFTLVPGEHGKQVGADHQQVDIDRPASPAQVALTSNDWGGWTELTVTADLTDGRTLVGHLANKPPGAILFPYRTKGSKIAEEWKKQHGVTDKQDNDDAEDTPEGKKSATGDGFTLYEEYRGMQCGGKHITLDPKKKDLFVRNTIGPNAATGIGYLRSATKLEVHDCLADGEMTPKRVMNSNHKDGPHVVDQHALVLTTSDKGASESIGTPGEVESVSVDAMGPHVAAQGQLDWDVSIGHELLHGLGVEHHGSGDKTPVYWEYSRTGDVIERSDTGATITVDDGAGHPRKRGDQLLDLLVSDPQHGTSVKLYVATFKGEHSGDDNCLMHYAYSQPIDLNSGRVYVTIFADESSPNLRHLVTQREHAGTQLCTAKTGTGNNAAGHKPLRWHGDATLGDCAHQFVVNDKHPIGKHAAKKN